MSVQGHLQDLVEVQAVAVPENRPTQMNVYVQRITDQVMQFYELIPRMVNQSNDTRLSILKSTRVRPQALTLALGEYTEYYQCPKLKQDVRNVMHSVANMFPGGDTRLFVHHTNQNLNTEMEIICVAVSVYDINGQNACDFCLATYSYHKSVDERLLRIGDSAITTGLLFGALNLTNIAMFGTFEPLCGTLGIVMSLVGIFANREANNTAIPEHLKDILEANFLYELVNRGHAKIEDRKLFITSEQH